MGGGDTRGRDKGSLGLARISTFFNMSFVEDSFNSREYCLGLSSGLFSSAFFIFLGLVLLVAFLAAVAVATVATTRAVEVNGTPEVPVVEFLGP